jgi:N-methylhydantoinase A/oxoprolinase/acetone carboxylase beta subunit
MILGIDVGGTHTDAVLLARDGILATAKVVTNHGNLLESISKALEEVLDGRDPADLERFNLSTTLCTNAIVQEELAEVGVLVTAGPGIDPALYAIGDHYEVLPGGLDHRGTEVKGLDQERMRKTVQGFLDKGLEVFAVVGKFSPRNPSHEQGIAELLQGRCSFLTQGHTISGQLNFPRRIATAYYNSAVWPLFNSFANSVSASLQERGMSPHINILKADGGTMTFAQSKQTPVESIFSGPAASIMGINALCELDEDALLLDIGGTTTDVAVFASGDPLIEPESVELERPTLVRAMKARSMGIGGDSAVRIQKGELIVGPKRAGPCLAQGGPEPTFIDALNAVGELSYGDVQASSRGIDDLASRLELSREETAKWIIRLACRKMRVESMAMLEFINERPIYTVHEFLQYRKIAPKHLYLMGGPAEVMAPFLGKEFGLPVVVPDNYQVANALGAAMARPTHQIELFADTEKRTLSIPVLEVFQRISGSYNLEQAKSEARAHLRSYLADSLGVGIEEEEIDVIEESAMNMVKDFSTVGRDIRVKCQVKPGISPEYKDAARCVC